MQYNITIKLLMLMYQSLSINDSCLRGKSIIGVKDIANLLPEHMKKQVSGIRVGVDYEGPKWVIYLKDNVGAFLYTPFSKEIIYHSYATFVKYERIYFYCRVNYLRDQYLHKGSEKKVYATYLCRNHHMFLLKESKQYWFDDGSGMGYSTKTKWFRAFP